jgi:serine/threonine protein kinase
LADFGIARQLDGISGLTATNMTVGTVSHAAPEQLTGSAQRCLDKLRQQLAQHIWMSRGEWLCQHLTQVDIVNCGIPLARTVTVPETDPGGAVSGYTHRLAKHSVLSA